jgi:flagellar basal-body rod protein FlgB
MSQINAPFRTFPLLEQLAAFTERRHEVLTGNIANISTPDYKTRDLPVAKFQEALQQAVTNQQRSAQSPRSLTDMLGGTAGGSGSSASSSV